MRRLSLLGAFVLAACLLAGCEPTPSTPLAPDQKLPDVSKMTPEQMQALHKSNDERR